MCALGTSVTYPAQDFALEILRWPRCLASAQHSRLPARAAVKTSQSTWPTALRWANCGCSCSTPAVCSRQHRTLQLVLASVGVDAAAGACLSRAQRLQAELWAGPGRGQACKSLLASVSDYLMFESALSQVHGPRCLRCTFSTVKKITAKASRCTAVRDTKKYTLAGGKVGEWVLQQQ